MARLFPQLSDERLDELQSRAEARFYRACRDQLGPQYLVLHSIPYITRVSGEPRDGEADFVIFAPDKGLVVVEIKGGGVSYSPAQGQWYSVNVSGEKNPIKDPFAQVTKEKHAVLELIKAHRAWRTLGIKWLLVGHAVFLADVDRLDPLILPHAPREIMGGRQDLQDLEKWLQKVITFWEGEQPHSMPLTPAAMALVEELFCQPREVRPLVSAQLKEEETIRIQLTEQQTRILRILGQRRRAAICGGAGTGKTLLAVEKARQLASEGLRTLLLCFNRPLADHLKHVIGNQPNLLPMDFHQLCEWRVKEVERQTGRDLKEDAMLAYPGKDYYNVQLPYALALALEEVPDLYDAVIVDEGQDFREEFWLPVDMLLKDAKQSRLFVFYDPNQAVYRRPSTFPIIDVPFSLTINCRNTQFIHDAAYHYFAGELTDPPEIKGAPVEVIDAPSLSAQITRTLSLVVRLIVDEQVAPEDIAVLVPSLSKHSYYESLCARPLPRGITWAPERHRVPATVLIDTMHRFKGLEAAIVVLCGVDSLDPVRDRETLYVALSRPKSRLHLVGKADACHQILAARIG
jgi:hypothetical protein